MSVIITVSILTVFAKPEEAQTATDSAAEYINTCYTSKIESYEDFSIAQIKPTLLTNPTIHEETTSLTTTLSTYLSTSYTYKYENQGDYVVAQTIWNYLTNDMGLNKYCAAGIMGNIMTECGGQTLNIQPYITNSAGHYGICQWSLKYFPEIRNADLDTQLEFLKSTIKWILNDYGDRYYSGFNYEKFIAIQDEREAAKAFAHAYEGCGEYCAPRRLDHATEALRYFEGE